MYRRPVLFHHSGCVGARGPLAGRGRNGGTPHRPKKESTPVPLGTGTKNRSGEHRVNRRTCRAPGCWSPAASRFAAYCSPHRTALRRHGAVDQKAITKAQLKPYLKLVQARIKRNKENAAWYNLDHRFELLVE